MLNIRVRQRFYAHTQLRRARDMMRFGSSHLRAHESTRIHANDVLKIVSRGPSGGRARSALPRRPRPSQSHLKAVGGGLDGHRGRRMGVALGRSSVASAGEVARCRTSS